MQLPGQVAPPCANDRPRRGALTTQPKRQQRIRPRSCASPTVVAPANDMAPARSIDRPPPAAVETAQPILHVQDGHCAPRPAPVPTVRRPLAIRHRTLTLMMPCALASRVLSAPKRLRPMPPERANPAVQSRPRSAPALVPGYGQHCMHAVARSGDGARRRLRRVCPAPEVPASRAPPCAACARPCFTCAFSLAEQWHLHPPFDDRARPTVALHAPSLQ